MNQRKLSLVVAAADILYGLSLYAGSHPRRISPTVGFLFACGLVLVGCWLIWVSEDVIKVMGTDIDPTVAPLYRNATPRNLKLFGWFLLLIFIPGGIWFAQQMGRLP